MKFYFKSKINIKEINSFLLFFTAAISTNNEILKILKKGSNLIACLSLLRPNLEKKSLRDLFKSNQFALHLILTYHYNYISAQVTRVQSLEIPSSKNKLINIRISDLKITCKSNITVKIWKQLLWRWWTTTTSTALMLTAITVVYNNNTFTGFTSRPCYCILIWFLYHVYKKNGSLTFKHTQA